MRKSPLFVALATIVLVVMASATSALAMKAPEANEVPISGSVVGEHSIDPTAPGCAVGSLWRFNSSGSGHMSHLGGVDYELTQCTTFDPATGGFGFGDGTIVFTAANGDTLVVAQIGTSEAIVGPDGQPVGFTLEGTWEAVGGTGRFTNVSGQGWMDGTGDIPGDAHFNFTGQIAYKRSK